MRPSEKACADIEFPGRYFLDEARFSGGHDRCRKLVPYPHSSPEEANA